MRWFSLGIAATVFLAETPCLAAETSPVLQENDIPIEVAAAGISILPADTATVTLNLRKPGPTRTEARANVRALADQLTAELVGMGLPKQSISLEEPTNRLDFVGNEAISEPILTAGQAVAAIKSSVAMASLELSISDLGFLPKLRGLIDQKDAVVMENPAFSLSDDRPARNAAINDAILKARADADAYAASLGMKVHRVISAKDQSAQSNFLFPDYEKMFERLSGQPGVKSGMVKTSARVIVQFALRPK